MLPFQSPDVFLNLESDLFLKIIFLECAKLFTKKKKTKNTFYPRFFVYV